MTRRLNRFRRCCYNALSTQPLESRLYLSAVAVTDQTDDYESSEFEELEELVEEAHEYGYQFELQEHHVPELVDDVIAHVAEELLIPPTDLHQLVISSDRDSSGPGLNEETVTVASLKNTIQDLESSDVETDKLPVSTALLVTGLSIRSGQSDDQTADGSRAEIVSEEDPPDAREQAAGSVADLVSSDTDDATGKDVTLSIDERNSVTDQAMDGGMTDTNPVMKDESGLLSESTESESESAIEIWYGSTFDLLNQQISLPFTGGIAADLNNMPNRATAASATSNATLMLAAGLAAGILAASNAHNSPAIHKIVRRIRRSIRPAV